MRRRRSPLLTHVTTVRFHEDEHEVLERLADEQDVHVAELIREAVREKYLNHHTSQGG